MTQKSPDRDTTIEDIHATRPALKQGRIEGSDFPKPIFFSGDTTIQRLLPGVLFRTAASGASRTSLHELHELAAGEGLRQRLTGLLQRFNRLFDHFTEFDEHLRGIVAIGSAVHQLWTGADEALVFV